MINLILGLKELNCSVMLSLSLIQSIQKDSARCTMHRRFFLLEEIYPCLKRNYDYSWRKTTQNYNRFVLKQLIPQLIEQDFVIASGLARGVDGIAHQETLKNNGKTIAIVGNGLNHFYPQENKELQEEIVAKGLLISEYLPDTPPRPYRFPERNRILAGLSKNIIVTEARKDLVL